ncbi:UNVERIFIED_CONTAM: hypothetical protein Sradi_1242800 [Sesamum radiatum]|uniref:Uncharacterized protein n=1 Tax=Sesamum radiatum TaxID=300843 RepID=A0AAW2UP04_SESRA
MNWKPAGLAATRPRRRSQALLPFVKTPAGQPPPPPAEDSLEALYNLQDDEEKAEILFLGREKKVLFDIGFGPRAARNGDNVPELGPGTAAATVASSCGDGKARFHSECDSSFTAEEVLDEHKKEKERRQRCWEALLDVAEDALREYEENLGKTEQNRRASREPGDGGEWLKRWAKKNSMGQCRIIGEVDSYDLEVAAEVVAPPVMRSKRETSVALPNKFRDSLLSSVVAAEEFSRPSRSGKSATNRKSR